LLATVNT